MDGTSPGLPPMSLGDMWVGTTACAPSPALGPQNCIVEWPQWNPQQPWNPAPTIPFTAPYVAPVNTHYHFTPQRLSDEDVDRIARRVAELLREAKP